MIAHLPTLPLIRRILLSLLLLSSTLLLVLSSSLLAYQLSLTRGYQLPIPAIITSSFLATTFSSWFLFGSNWANLGNAWIGFAKKVTRSIACEVTVMAVVAGVLLGATADLQADTPGLITGHCGKFVICHLLLAVLALSWITFLLLALSGTLLLLSTLYLSLRRRHVLPIFTTSFTEVNWNFYKGRPLNRGQSEKLKVLHERKAGGIEGKVVVGVKDNVVLNVDGGGELEEEEKGFTRFMGREGKEDWRHSLVPTLRSEISSNDFGENVL